MAKVRAVVLRAAGINCDLETDYALEKAGAESERIHINRIIRDKGLLREFQIMVIPGGFSYGDDVAAGRILANQIRNHLYEPLKRFIEDGKLVLGICNGFQVLVKCGILPGFADGDNRQYVTITHNDSGRFEARWVYLSPESDRCVFIEPKRIIYLPVANGEGKVVTTDESVLERLESENHIAFKYVDAQGKEGPFPINPSGSAASIAALTDSTGRVLGLMPHPERFICPARHPRRTRPGTNAVPDGMTIFDNAVRYMQRQ